MKTMTRAFGAGVLLAVLPGLALAAKKVEKKDETVVGVSIDASVLLGVGISVGMGFADRFNVRLAHHAYTYEYEEEGDAGDPDYDGEIELKNTALLLDWHPWQGAFRLTGGLVKNGNGINLTATDNGGEYEFNDCTFESDPSDPLRVNGTVDFKDTAPYLGLGWGGNMNAEPGFFATFDLGVMFSGAPDASLKGRGSARNANAAQAAQCGDPVNYQDVSGYQEFKDAIAEAEDEANDEAEDYKLWPNIAFGLGWRF